MLASEVLEQTTLLYKLSYNRTSFPKNYHNTEEEKPCLCVTHIKEMMKKDTSSLIKAIEATFPEVEGTFQSGYLAEMKRKQKENASSDRNRPYYKTNSRRNV